MEISQRGETIWQNDLLFYRRPDAVDVVVVVERLQKFADFGALRVGQFGKLLRNVADFARHHRPAVWRKPFGNGVNRRAVADELRAGRAFGNVVVLLVRQRFHFVRAGFDGGGFAVNGRVGMMRLDQADVVEQKLVAAGGAELALLLNSTRISGAVRFTLSVYTSTMTGTLCGA